MHNESLEATTVKDEDIYTIHPPWKCKAKDIKRWNKEWSRYLLRGFDIHLAPHTDYPDSPNLPDNPMDLVDLSLGWGPPLVLYCHRDAIKGKRIMELGCGCGNMGKLLGRYAKSFLGMDYSTLALKVARLVSPKNCTYVHLTDGAGFKPFKNKIDTVIGRHFWIHQNMEMGRYNIEFMLRFLKPGGRLYADFFWETVDKGQDLLVLSPQTHLSINNPSATFLYQPEDVEELIKGFPLEIVGEEISTAMQRRYVVFKRTS